MELLFLALLIVLMVWALGSGFPVAFALPGAAILSISAAALAGWIFAGDTGAYFAQGGPAQWLTAKILPIYLSSHSLMLTLNLIVIIIDIT